MAAPTRSLETQGVAAELRSNALTPLLCASTTLFFICMALFVWSSSSAEETLVLSNDVIEWVPVEFGTDAAQGCCGARQGMDLRWAGRHNLEEVLVPGGCEGAHVHNWTTDILPRDTQFFLNLCASAGATRYFRCSPHCHVHSFSISCPS